MAYQVTIEPTTRYLHVRVTGENSREAVLGYLAEVNRACAEQQCTNVLIEEDLRGPSLNMLEIFRMVADRAGAPGVVPLRIAFVDVNPEHDAGRLQFAENVAVNRGLQLRVFARAEDAAAWL